MKQTKFIWVAFLTCAAVVAAAMAAITNHALTLEKARLLGTAETELGEKIRLALWRMDTEAATLLCAENNRPPAEFNGCFTNNKPTGRNSIRESPVITSVVQDQAILRFEINETGQLSASQAALDPGSEKQANEFAAAMARLRKLLGLVADQQMVQSNPNLDMAVAAANVKEFANAPLTQDDAQGPDEKAEPQQQQAKVGQSRKPVSQKSGKESVAYQNEYNSRQALVQRAIASNSLNNGAQQVAGVEQGLSIQPMVSLPPVQITGFKALWLESELFLVRAVEDNGCRRMQGVWLRTDTLAESLLVTIRDLLPAAALVPFQPLVFTRDRIPDTTQVAGSNKLTALASSFTVKAGSYDRAPLALVTLPWQLVPGEKAQAGVPLWSPLHTLLAVAWSCVVLAMLAVAMLLGGVVALSERRASFVSSVTHELRTPLTTFRLYSEMLAEDMVPEPAQRKTYLQTLQTEASRLTHLVENVLAYSRIERGSARARIEQTTVASLVARLEPRFIERCAAAGMAITVAVPEDVSNIELSLDVTAVEQILFNLVDNACKYGHQDDPGKPLQLSFGRSNKIMQIRLRDHGHGVSPRMRKALFKPFHKSAQDAAASKPGVGLGLSLSRRLARALGGNLILETATGPGACFLLELPIRD